MHLGLSLFRKESVVSLPGCFPHAGGGRGGESAGART